jgi:hypothetical protein
VLVVDETHVLVQIAMVEIDRIWEGASRDRDRGLRALSARLRAAAQASLPSSYLSKPCYRFDSSYFS